MDNVRTALKSEIRANKNTVNAIGGIVIVKAKLGHVIISFNS
jgi:hypothetical protein